MPRRRPGGLLGRAKGIGRLVRSVAADPRDLRTTWQESVRDWAGGVVDGTTRAQHPQGLPEVLAADDPGAAVAGGVAVPLGRRPDGIPALAATPRRVPPGSGARPDDPGLPVGHPRGEPGTRGQPRPVADPRPG